MRRLAQIGLVGLVLLAVPGPGGSEELEAEAVFERLKSLAGSWHGTPQARGAKVSARADAVAPVGASTAVYNRAKAPLEVDRVHHEFRVSAAGSVVMETMSVGTAREMVNMYHLDDDELVLTHYCAIGNQPTMRLDRQGSSDVRLVFEFSGGTNLDPTSDQHIHSAEIRLVDSDRLESEWTAHAAGEEIGVMVFHLARAR